MDIKAARRRYAGEWVAVRVTRVDRADVPLEGDVVAPATDRRALHEMARDLRAGHPDARVFILFAGDPIPAGLVISLAAR
ncbi:MAG TPA: hypothetical protein VN812_08670 [Candidatus Acidoferrales bacterium]|nr:hypothetical protein [Candidatus Acidoferrales bacterium]